MEFFIKKYITDTFLLLDNVENEIILKEHCFEIYDNKNIYSFRYSIIEKISHPYPLVYVIHTKFGDIQLKFSIDIKLDGFIKFLEEKVNE